MKILFVCRANVGRSQMAAAFYNRLFPGGAASAGTLVNLPGQAVSDVPRAKNAITVMQAVGLDIANNQRTQLQPAMLAAYDAVIVMAEKSTIPVYLAQSPKVIYWDIADPGHMDLDDTRRISQQIQQQVEALAHQTNH